jgi:hypothetical protein
MNRIDFAKKCMTVETKRGLCDGIQCRECLFHIETGRTDSCTDKLRKAWAKKVLAEAAIQPYKGLLYVDGLYPPSTFIATPALAEPREEEEYEIEAKQKAKFEQEKESIAGSATCMTCGKLFTSYGELARQCRSCYDKNPDANQRLWEAAQEKEKTIRFESPIRPEDVVTLQVGKGLLPEDMEWKDAPLFEKESTGMFEPKTRGGFEYEIYRVRTDGNRYPIHGAVKDASGEWSAFCWDTLGRAVIGEVDNYDLIPLKQRRFKTAEELVASGYSSVEFQISGTIYVWQGGHSSIRKTSDTPEGNYSKEWLDVFTCFCSEDIKD